MPATEQFRLPAEPSSFVGRQRDVVELRRLVGNVRAVTLAGPGGIGKSRLALRVAAAVRPDFPDGVVVVGLADVAADSPAEPTTARIAAQVQASLGVHEEFGRMPQDAACQFLRGRRMLLVLDNCEHVAESCGRWCAHTLAAWPELHVLTTSRQSLRFVGELVWRVPALTVPAENEPTDVRRLSESEAVRLFVDRIRAANPEFRLHADNAAAVASICRVLEGVPLAIELAAARARLLSAEQIEARLDDRFRLLSRGERDFPSRQRTLRAAVDWSHALLTEPERVLLRRLSVFVGGFTLDTVERVCADEQLPADGILDLVGALMDKSLVIFSGEVAGKARYRLLETIREYAAERLIEAGEQDRLRTKHRDAMTEICERSVALLFGLGTADWSELNAAATAVQVDLDNHRAGLAWSLRRGDGEAGLRQCIAFGRLWILRGDFPEAAAWLEKFLRLGTAGASARTRGAALVLRAELVFHVRRLAQELDEAIESALTGLRLCRAAGANREVTWALNTLALLMLAAGRLEEADDWAAQAIELARTHGDGWYEGYALTSAAAVALHRGDVDRAEWCGLTGLAVYRDEDNRGGRALLLLGLGTVARVRGDLVAALRLFEAALPVLRALGAKAALSRCLAGIARIAIEQGGSRQARTYLAESLELASMTGQQLAVARGLEAFAELAAECDCPRRAAWLLGASRGLRYEVGSPKTMRSDEVLLVTLRRRLGETGVKDALERGRRAPIAEAIEVALSEQDDLPAGWEEREPGLTVREREIAGLVASGMTNRQIGEQLVISPLTVARHVANILTKLGFSSRAQIAAWTTERGAYAG